MQWNEWAKPITPTPLAIGIIIFRLQITVPKHKLFFIRRKVKNKSLFLTPSSINSDPPNPRLLNLELIWTQKLNCAEIN
jgi:hypothetical protein